MQQRGSGAARLRAVSQAPRPNKPDLLVLIGRDYLFLVLSLFQSATDLNTLPHKSCHFISLFKLSTGFVIYIQTGVYSLTFVAKYAFFQAPSHPNHALPGSASNSRTGSKCYNIQTATNFSGNIQFIYNEQEAPFPREIRFGKIQFHKSKLFAQPNSIMTM